MSYCEKFQAYKSKETDITNSHAPITYLPQLSTHNQELIVLKNPWQIWNNVIYLNLINLAFFFSPYVLKLCILQVTWNLFIIIY